MIEFLECIYGRGIQFLFACLRRSETNGYSSSSFPEVAFSFFGVFKAPIKPVTGQLRVNPNWDLWCFEFPQATSVNENAQICTSNTFPFTFFGVVGRGTDGAAFFLFFASRVM